MHGRLLLLVLAAAIFACDAERVFFLASSATDPHHPAPRQLDLFEIVQGSAILRANFSSQIPLLNTLYEHGTPDLVVKNSFWEA